MSTKERIKKFSKKTLDKCIPYIKLKEFSENIQINPEEAKDCLIYGMQAIKYEKQKKTDIVIYSSDYSQTEIIVLDKFPKKIDSLDLKMLLDVSFIFKDNIINNFTPKKKTISCFSSICYSKSPNHKNSNAKSKKINMLNINDNINNINNKKNNLKINNNNNINNSISSNNSLNNYSQPINMYSNNLNGENNNTNNDSSTQENLSKRYISLIKSMGEKIEIIFKSEYQLKVFAYALYLIYHSENNEEEEKPNLNVFEKHLRKIWHKFDKNHLLCLDLPDFTRMVKLMDQNYNCISLNIKDDKSIRVLFGILDKDSIGKVYFEDFYNFYNEIIAGAEFEEVFLKYSKGKQYMNIEDLTEFMQTEQKQNLNSDEIAEIFDDYKIEIPETARNSEQKGGHKKKHLTKLKSKKYYQKRGNIPSEKVVEGNEEKNKSGKIECKLNLMEFKNFISDINRCNVLDLNAYDVEHDMTKPLNDYFIFSSHNTFLNKNIYGEGSLEMFNYAILEGCRMLELECHDGDKEPKINAGNSILNEVFLKDALINLREHSFKLINLPMLISLENFCNKEQQLILAQYLKDILKDVYTLNINKLPDKYPSPKELEGKFIIKESKNLNMIKRKSSLPMANVGKLIKNTDVEYTINLDAINNSRDISNSFSNSNPNAFKELDEELMNYVNMYNLDITGRNEEIFDYEEFEDIPDENIIRPSLLNKCFSILDRRLERNLDNPEIFSREITLKNEGLNKLNTYGNIVINEWIDKSHQNGNNSTNKSYNKSNSLIIQNKSPNQSELMNNFYNKNDDQLNDDDERLLSANRANNALKKKQMGASFLSEIKEKEDDYESSYKKNCRSKDSDNLTNTLNRINSKFSDSNVYNRNYNNSDSSNRLNSLHFSIDRNLDLSSQNRSSQNKSSKKQVVNQVNIVKGNNSITMQNSPNTNQTLNSATNLNILKDLNNPSSNYYSNPSVQNINSGPNTNSNPDTNSNLNINNSLNNINNKNFNYQINTSINNNSGAINIISTNRINTINHQNNDALAHSKTIANERPQNQKNRNNDNSYCIRELQDLAGLVKKRFYLSKLDDELFYNPWDCPVIKESELAEIFKDHNLRTKLVKYCKNSFIKVKPNKASKISTINFDPVKAWICGIQIAAMNIQSLEDDHVLINKIFFKFNKGCGIVLKPDFLRDPKNKYDRFYLKPLMKIKIDIISCLMLQTCVRNFNKQDNIYFESYLVGSWEDDKINPKYKSKTYGNHLINLVFDNESIKFDVYEPQICFWMIKIYLSNNLIARSCVPISIMNEGIRVVSLVDMNCNEYEDCVLLVRITKNSNIESI